MNELGQQTAQNPGAWAEINLKHLCHNARVLQGKLPAGAELMAVVKADGYGHGAVEVSRAMNKMGVMHFGVANLAEGITLRQAGIQGEILIFGGTSLADLEQVRRYDLTQTVIDAGYAQKIMDALADSEKKHPLKEQTALNVQLKIDTGMHRYGTPTEETEQILEMLRSPYLAVAGIYTHFSACDVPTEEGRKATERQMEQFAQLLERLRSRLNQDGRLLPKTHLQSSYGMLNYAGVPCDMARVGIALYGEVDPGMMVNPEDAAQFLPVLSVKARVSLLREVKTGACAGYGLEACEKSDRRLALLSIGYADGIPRCLGESRAWVMIRGERAPIVGRICMDCLLVDVTAIAGVEVDDVAVLIDGEGKGGMDVAEMARQCATIPNEIVSRLGARLPKFFL